MPKINLNFPNHSCSQTDSFLRNYNHLSIDFVLGCLLQRNPPGRFHWWFPPFSRQIGDYRLNGHCILEICFGFCLWMQNAFSVSCCFCFSLWMDSFWPMEIDPMCHCHFSWDCLIVAYFYCDCVLMILPSPFSVEKSLKCMAMK